MILDDEDMAPLLEDVFRTYHYDFRHYSPSSLKRAVGRALQALALSSVAELRHRIGSDPRTFSRFLPYLTVQVSDLFRDATYWRALREQVVPHLATYPFLRVWIAGCGAGEEAYSMAILLAEAALLDRCQLYATDIAANSLEKAASGRVELERLRSFSDNYFTAGGAASLSDYYETTPTHALFDEALRRRILFSDHSLATDAAFAEVQLVSCRNVLIYFDKTLQDRALGLFAEALCARGFLGLGEKESLAFSSHGRLFEPVVASDNIYRKRSP